MNIRARTAGGLAAVVAEHPVLAVVGAGRELEAVLNEDLSREALSLPRLTVLHVVSTAGGRVGLKDVATALGCAKSNASALVDRMQRDLLLVRAVDPEDQRGVLLSVTPRGDNAYRAGLAAVVRQQESMFADLDVAERDVLIRLLTRITR